MDKEHELRHCGAWHGLIDKAWHQETAPETRHLQKQNMTLWNMIYHAKTKVVIMKHGIVSMKQHQKQDFTRNDIGKIHQIFFISWIPGILRKVVGECNVLNLCIPFFWFPQDLLESGIIIIIFYNLRFENCYDIWQVTTQQVVHQQLHHCYCFEYWLEG